MNKHELFVCVLRKRAMKNRRERERDSEREKETEERECFVEKIK